MRPAPSAQTVCPEGSAYCILYDADCGICSRAILWLQRQSIGEPVRWLPIGGEEAQHLLPNRPVDEMAVVGPKGEVWLGARGVITCLHLARYTWLAAIANLPPLRVMVELGYGLVARNRGRLSRWFGLRACKL